MQCPYCRSIVTLLVIGDESGLSQDELTGIRNYNANYCEVRDMIDSILNLPTSIRNSVRELIDSRGRIIFRNWQFNMFLAVIAWYYLISYCPADGGIPELVYNIFCFVDDFALVIIVAVGMLSHVRFSFDHMRIY